MNYRLATISPRTEYTADTTIRIDIDVKDPISQIQILYAMTMGAYASMAGHPAENVTKIELLDGSEVLYSLSGVEAQSADYYHNGIEPYSWLRYLNGNETKMMFNMNFGRFLYDPELAFDPTKFNNPRLEITLDIDACGHNVATGRPEVTAHLFDEKAISPIGFLMHKEIKDYTLVTDGHEYTDLPTDHPYRKLFIRAQRDDYTFVNQLQNLKLSEDVDKRVVFNHGADVLIERLSCRVKPFTEVIRFTSGTVSQKFFCTPTFEVDFGASTWRTTAPDYCAIYEGDGGRFQVIGATDNRNSMAILRGILPHAVLEIAFGLQDDMADWYDVKGIGNLKLDLTGGTSVGTSQTCQVFLQQLRRY